MTVLGRQEAAIAQGALVPAGGPLIGQEFIWIYDQTGVLWAWWISLDLASDWGPVPDLPFDQEIKFYLIPWWLTLVDDEGVVWYVYPEVDGSPIAQIAQPANGEGIVGSPALRVRGGPSRYRYKIVGGAIDVVSA